MKQRFERSLLLCISLIGCGLFSVMPAEGQEPGSVPTIHSSNPSIPKRHAWTIGTTPLFEAGALGNKDNLDLYNVRDMVRLQDGTTVVANSGQLELVFLSSLGEVIAVTGGRGEGPGEFLRIGSFGHFRGDSVYAVDYARGSVSIFDGKGGFGRAVLLHSLVPPGYWPDGALPDGRFLVRSDAFMIGGGFFPQDSTWMMIVDPETLASDTVGQFLKSFAGDPPGSMALGPMSIVAIGEDYFYWGRGDAFEFRQYGLDGTLSRIISKDWEPFRVTDRSWRRFGEARIEELRRSRTPNLEDLIRRARQENERIEHAEFLPAFSDAIVDTDGNLWVREYPLRGVRVAPWQVFSSSGSWITTVEVPDGLRLYAAGRDWVLGLATDELDVEVVRLMPLVK